MFNKKIKKFNKGDIVKHKLDPDKRFVIVGNNGSDLYKVSGYTEKMFEGINGSPTHFYQEYFYEDEIEKVEDNK